MFRVKSYRILRFCYSLCRALLVLAEYPHPYFSYAP